MNKIKIGINGFGRIGRLAARIILTKYSHEMEIVGINDLTSAENLAYLFEFDSTYRRFEHPVLSTESSIMVPDLKVNIPVFSQPNPKLIPWKEVQTEVILECTGRFLSTELASQHLNDKIKKIILSAPAKDTNIPTVVIGVNHDNLNSTKVKNQKIVSNASCTTNCIAPALKVLNDNYIIQNVLALTAHAYTATQFVQDSPSKKEFRDGRAAAVNAIPSTTGAAKAVELVIPSLKGKINLSSLRIPVISGSYIYLVVNFQDFTPTIEEINKLFKEQSKGNLKNILEYSEQNLVSSDVIGNSHSCIFDANLTEVNGNSAKIVLWYDNEWGYANRLVEMIKLI
jgi:glyceraldehyde 3-phosphate dehydrogenase